jgi:large subunit ribosomal protein L10
MERSQKAEAIKDIRARFDKMSSAVFLDFTGMTVDEVSKLRDKFREKGIDYKVVKNKLVEQALADHAWSKGLKPILRGMTGVAWSFEEPSAAARVVKDFVKENEKLKVKAGLLEGQILDSKAVADQLATLPNKDEARSMLLATMLAAPQTFVRLLTIPARDFVGVMAAKQRKDGGE